MKRKTKLFGKREEFTRMTLFMFMEDEKIKLLQENKIFDISKKNEIKQYIQYAGENNWNVISELEN